MQLAAHVHVVRHRVSMQLDLLHGLSLVNMNCLQQQRRVLAIDFMIEFLFTSNMQTFFNEPQLRIPHVGKVLVCLQTF